MAAYAAAFARRERDGNIRFSGEALRLRGEREGRREIWNSRNLGKEAFGSGWY